MNPMSHQEWYNRFYAEQFWEWKAKKGDSDLDRNEFQWIKELRRARKCIDFLSKANVALLEGARILEIGCAYGLIVRSMADYFGSGALGVEPSHTARLFAERHREGER